MIPLHFFIPQERRALPNQHERSPSFPFTTSDKIYYVNYAADNKSCMYNLQKRL